MPTADRDALPEAILTALTQLGSAWFHCGMFCREAKTQAEASEIVERINKASNNAYAAIICAMKAENDRATR